MGSILDLRSTNWSYYTVPIAFMLVMVPHAYSIVLAGKNYDLDSPRRTEDLCAKDTSLGKAVLRRISRAKAASANGFETLGLYAAGVVAANVAQVETEAVNKLALTYLVSRAVYNFVYVHLQDNKRMAPIRSLVWLVSLYAIFALFVKAGIQIN
ncbi:hypothetical protein B0T25DRAFT_538820 [Lasiosphaeria hispida]|uniref:Uncharacterized protein n=1 Tax=Lasiosphaeria hispida TaxID=260671 RepID=A0AAJ0HLX1_9PEZI|nr:hypothetical protein B0T25DRAFT_538820 [Lasiosphaeria hispida]